MNRPSMTQMYTCLCLPKEAEIKKDTTTGQQNSNLEETAIVFEDFIRRKKEKKE